MAIRTPNLALCDLFLDRFPLEAVSDHLRDVAHLGPTHVVELENNGVGLAAIDARMREQVRMYERPRRGHPHILVVPNSTHLTFVIVSMTFGLIRREAGFAPGLKVIRVTPSLREIDPRFQNSAPETEK
jgi:hypothetical protein